MTRDQAIRDGYEDGKNDAEEGLPPRLWDVPPTSGVEGAYRHAYRTAYRAYANDAGRDMLDGG